MLKERFNPFPILQTERLTLRQLLIDDAQEIFALRSDAEINKYLGRQASKTIDEAKNFINKIIEGSTKNESVYWAITFTGKNVLVGTICLFGFSGEGSGCEIGYELLTKFQGQGIMLEAASKVIGYAFEIIKVQEIKAELERDNKGSVKLLKKLNFLYSNKVNKEEPELVIYHLINKK